MAAEFPGAQDAQSLWKVLKDGLNTIQQIPPHRFDTSAYYQNPDRVGRSMKVNKGNFLRDADVFDHAFFDISPREARSMDPQQRVLLRVAHDALEDAGYVSGATPSFDPDFFATFVGVATNDYVQNLRNDIDVYYSTGTLQAFLSGRISYAFGFGGPSLVLDTACSSSMAAIYQACRALENGDCNAAIAGGVNVITSPDMYFGLSRGHFLSDTGQCRPWDASADGYCRSEGCGLFVLKRLDDAIAENDQILGVIRGIEMNQSGNARSITHPHVPTQVALFEKLVSSSGISAHDITVSECHGTGTQAGDPAECEAVRKVFATGRTEDNPLHLTSIKGNIGHAEAASGAASLVKLILMLRKRTIPRHISFQRLNPKIPDLTLDGVRIDMTAVPWECRGTTRLALLTNFGAAGSNSALILEEYVHAPRTPTITQGLILGISCKSVEAVEARRQTYLARLEQTITDESSLQDFAYSATARRQLYRYRMSVSGGSKGGLLASLRSASVLEVRPAADVIFVFSGQGAQYVGMGGTLYEHILAFARIVKECHHKLLALGYPGILHVFQDPAFHLDDSNRRQFQSLQAALFVLEYAIAQLWISWGIQPRAVVGHSFGEFAALAVAGALTLDDALIVVARRAEAIATQCIPNRSGMTSVRACVAEFVLGIPPFAGLEVCCYNSESSFVVGGNLSELQSFEDLCTARGVRFTRLEVPYAYHSAAMDPVLECLETLSGDVTLSAPKIPVLSNVTGTFVMPGDTAAYTADYFARHCRSAALFQQGIVDLSKMIDFSTIAAWIEVGPHSATLPLLRGMAGGEDQLLLPSLRKNTPGFETLCSSLAELYRTSVSVEWRKVFADLAPDARLVDLPTYPFARTRFWVPYEEEPSRPQPEAKRSLISGIATRAPSIDGWMNSFPAALGMTTFEIDVASFAGFIEGHQVLGVALCPASVYTEMVLSCVASMLESTSVWKKDSAVGFSDVVYPKPLVYVFGSARRLRVEVSASGSAQERAGSFKVSLCDTSTNDSEVYCRGAFRPTTLGERSSKFAHNEAIVKREIQAVSNSGSPGERETFTTRTVYDLLFPSIVAYSDVYRAIRTITVNASTSSAYAVIQIPKVAPSGAYAVHPVFVDALFHVAGFLVNFTRGMNGKDAYICSRVDKVHLLPQLLDLSAGYGVYAAMTQDEGDVVSLDVYAVEVDVLHPRIVARLKRAQFRRVPLEGFRRVLQSAARDSNPTPLSEERRSLYPVASSTPKRRPTPIWTGAQDLEQRIIAIVADTAGILAKDTRMDARLTHLGIDSLMLWEVSARLRVLLPGRTEELSAHGLSGAATIAELVQLVIESCREDVPAATPSVEDSVRTLCEDAAGSRQSTLDLQAVKGVFSAVLDVPIEDIADTSPLQSLGLDSLTSIEARHVFQVRFGVKVNEETLFECRTVQDVLEALKSRSEFEPNGPCPPAVGEVFSTPKEAKEVTSTTTSVWSGFMDECPSFPFLQEGRFPITERSTRVIDRRDGIALVRLQHAPANSQPKPLLFLIHDGTGSVTSYARLAPLGCNVFAFENRDFARCIGTTSCGNLVDTLAASYSEILLKNFFSEERLCSETKCCVGGWSFGGVVAFALSRRLLDMGVRVKGLVLIDAPAPQTESPLPECFITRLVNRFVAPSQGTSSGGGVPNSPAHERVEAKEDAKISLNRQLNIATKALVSYRPGLSGGMKNYRAVYLRAMEATDHVLLDATKEGFDGRVKAFLTKHGDKWTLPLWKELLAEGMEVLDVPGDHFNLFHPRNVNGLSKQIRAGIGALAE
ncbi:ketoacyl-synt-domain-containing protein [Trametes maxima]|nr:ketoacyl-synt-domain-containing protein [Trametes maxima]